MFLSLPGSRALNSQHHVLCSREEALPKFWLPCRNWGISSELEKLNKHRQGPEISQEILQTWELGSHHNGKNWWARVIWDFEENWRKGAEKKSCPSARFISASLANTVGENWSSRRSYFWNWISQRWWNYRSVFACLFLTWHSNNEIFLRQCCCSLENS